MIHAPHILLKRKKRASLLNSNGTIRQGTAKVGSPVRKCILTLDKAKRHKNTHSVFFKSS